MSRKKISNYASEALKFSTLLMVALYIIGLAYDQSHLSNLGIHDELFSRQPAEYLTESLYFFLYLWNKSFESLSENPLYFAYSFLIPGLVLFLFVISIELERFSNRRYTHEKLKLVEQEELYYSTKNINNEHKISFINTSLVRYKKAINAFTSTFIIQISIFIPYYVIIALITPPYLLGIQSAKDEKIKYNKIIDGKKESNEYISIYENEKCIASGFLITNSDTLFSIYTVNKKIETYTLDNKKIVAEKCQTSSKMTTVTSNDEEMISKYIFSPGFQLGHKSNKNFKADGTIVPPLK